MNRSWGIGIAAALAGLIIGVASTAIIVREDDDQAAAPAASETPFVFPTPGLTPVPTLSPATPSPSPSPTPSVTPAPSATPTATGSPTPAATTAPTSPPAQSRDPSTIDCAREPRYCSAADAMVVTNNTRQSGPTGTTTASREANPTFTQTSSVAPGSGEPETMAIDIVIRNTTQRTFFFPEVKLVLDLRRDGALEIRIPSTLRESFTMRPGTRVTGHFDVRLPQDQTRTKNGRYTWQVKTYFVER